MGWGINQELYNRYMQNTKTKITISFIMMFIAYNGFAQNTMKGKTRSIATFSNGDEAIEIIAKTDKNVIKLTTADDYNKYEILDLSNHEVNHMPSDKKKLIKVDTDAYYMVEGSDKEYEEEDEDTSGA